jgi:hypothetical protein
MAFRCEVHTTRRGWIIVDDDRGTTERPLPTREQYEAAILRMMPMLHQREYRITEYDAPPVRVLFTLRLPEL